VFKALLVNIRPCSTTVYYVVKHHLYAIYGETSWRSIYSLGCFLKLAYWYCCILAYKDLFVFVYCGSIGLHVALFLASLPSILLLLP